MDTNALTAPAFRRNRRHAPEFKARVIAACLQPGVSIAAVALANGLNANFLRSWVKAYRDQQGSEVAIGVASASGSAPAKRAAPTLVPVHVQAPSGDPSGTIEVEIRRLQTVVAIRWPTSEATACAQWLRDLLR
jgi:transposase